MKPMRFTRVDAGLWAQDISIGPVKAPSARALIKHRLLGCGHMVPQAAGGLVRRRLVPANFAAVLVESWSFMLLVSTPTIAFVATARRGNLCLRCMLLVNSSR